MKERFICEDEKGSEERVAEKTEDKVKVKYGAAFPLTIEGAVSCKLKDTGNGFIAKFPSYSSTEQDHYVTMDYSQALDLYVALALVHQEFTLTREEQKEPA